MEIVVDLYSEVHNEDEPLICMDEAAIQLQGHLYEPINIKPGEEKKEDYHYTRKGVQAIFMFLDPIAGWRRVSNREHRTRVDWTEEIRQLLDQDYPQARKVKLLCDNIAPLYEAFLALEARRLGTCSKILYQQAKRWLSGAEASAGTLIYGKSLSSKTRNLLYAS